MHEKPMMKAFRMIIDELIFKGKVLVKTMNLHFTSGKIYVKTKRGKFDMETDAYGPLWETALQQWINNQIKASKWKRKETKLALLLSQRINEAVDRIYEDDPEEKHWKFEWVFVNKFFIIIAALHKPSTEIKQIGCMCWRSRPRWMKKDE